VLLVLLLLGPFLSVELVLSVLVSFCFALASFCGLDGCSFLLLVPTVFRVCCPLVKASDQGSFHPTKTACLGCFGCC
jgi:hypothetical protein